LKYRLLSAVAEDVVVFSVGLLIAVLLIQ